MSDLTEQARRVLEHTETSLAGSRWRHSEGMIFCGTLRIAREDFDTNPSDEFKVRLFDEICRLMNNRELLPLFAKEHLEREATIQRNNDRSDKMANDALDVLIERDQLRAEVDRLRESLQAARKAMELAQGYMQHESSCDSMDRLSSPCSCGFHEALAALNAELEKSK